MFFEALDQLLKKRDHTNRPVDVKEECEGKSNENYIQGSITILQCKNDITCLQQSNKDKKTMFKR